MAELREIEITVYCGICNDVAEVEIAHEVGPLAVWVGRRQHITARESRDVDYELYWLRLSFMEGL